LIKEILEKENKEYKFEIWTICGADFATKYKIWGSQRKYVCIGRGKDTIILKKELENEEKNNIILVETKEVVDLSSTMIREKLENKEEIDKNHFHVKVYEYFKTYENDLYLKKEKKSFKKF
jgi:nicotinic acid mononucleotide adenylyltransferase